MVAASDNTVSTNDAGGVFGPGLLILSVAAAVAVFWFGIESLADAWSTPEYSHGPLIPIVSAYLFLRDMKHVPSAHVDMKDRWLGVWVVLFSLLLATVGNLSRIPDIVTYALIVWVWGMVLVNFGAARGRMLWPGILHLVFMLPLPNFIYWKMSIFLQGVSSEIGVWVIRLMDIPVFLDGHIIDLGDYKLQVAEACSGLRYLFPIMSFSYIFSLLYQGPKWHKAVLLLSAAPITVLMNSFRIGMIGVLVDNYGIEQAEGFLHAFEGWVIFGACVGILFMMSIGLQRISKDKRSIADALDLDFSGIPDELRRIKTLTGNTVAIAGFAMIGTFAVGTVALPALSQKVEVSRTPFVLFPNRLADWEGERQYLEPGIEAVLAADDYLLMKYVSRDQKQPVDFFIAYYDKLTEGGGIHSPEVCLPAGGWEISEIQKLTISVSTEEKGDIALPVNRAIIQKGLHRQLAYYWFDMRGRKLNGDYESKAYTIYDSIAYGRADGALVRVITPIAPNESEESAEKRLSAFLENAIPNMDAYLPPM